MIIKFVSKIIDMMPTSKHKSAYNLAHRLGWFSIGLGLLELVAAHRFSRALGLGGNGRSLIALYGVRELGTGIGILTARNPTTMVWARVAGDALDLLSLAAAFGDSRNKAGVGLAFMSVAAVTAVDLICAQTVSSDMLRRQAPTRDYSDRSGLPQGIGAVRRSVGHASVYATPS